MSTRRPSQVRACACVVLIAIAGASACTAREDRTSRSAETTLATPTVAPNPTVGPAFRADTPIATTARAAPSRGTAKPVSSPSPLPPPRTGPATPAGRPPSNAPDAPADSAAQRDSATANAAGAHLAAAPVPAPAPSPATRAFGVGERLTYDVRFGPIRVGQASMEVVGIEPFRGRDAYHTRFLVRGGTAFYRVNDRYESWFDARTLESLRYVQQIDQGSYERERLFEIFPERRTFTEAGKPGHQPSVADPLDDGSFLYFLRTIPLEVGKTYEFNRYFRPDRNPVRVTVVRRERIGVPAGTFDAIVVRPTIKTTGIFSEGGRAEVWFADDSTRRMIQMKSRLSFGSLSLQLRRAEP